MPDTTGISHKELVRMATENPLAYKRWRVQTDFKYFLKYFWDQYSADELRWNWHLDIICDELQQIAERVAAGLPKKYDLIINIPPGSTKPLWEETPVLMANGKYKPLKDIKPGAWVINKYGRPTKVTKVHEQGKLPTYSIKTFGGRELKAAGDHPILTTRGWVNTEDIKENDYLALMHSQENFSNSNRLNEEFPYHTDKVMSIEKDDELNCRCLSVEQGSSFIADGIVVHNTATVSIMFPAWIWTRWYWMRFITASYTSTLSLESAEYSRDVIKSPKYRALFPEIEIKQDKDTKSNFRIVKRLHRKNEPDRTVFGGYRFSTSIGGTLMGFHGNIQILDDPIDPQRASVESLLNSANEWVGNTLSTRKAQKDITPLILIQQRLHQNDPTGHILTKRPDSVKHICLPGEIKNYREQVRPQEFIDYYKDDLLDPVRLNWSTLNQMEQELGQYGYAGQIGQKPVPPGGGMFQVDNFQTIDQLPNPSQIIKRVRYWDKAGTAGGGDYTVGVKMYQVRGGKWIIVDVKRGQWSTNQREQIIRSTAEADGQNVEVWVEQEPGSGGQESAENTITNLAGFSVYADKVRGKKEQRADPFSVQVNNGNVMMMRGDWNSSFIEECRFFPYSTYKDQVDAASGAFAKLTKAKQVVIW